MSNVGLAIHEETSYDEISSIKKIIKEAISNYAGSSIESGLTKLVPSGSSVLVKPNWVYHKNHISSSSNDCLLSQRNFVIAVLSLLSDCHPSKVIIGDAPLQGCHLNEILSDDYVREMRKAAGIVDMPIVDFRRTVMNGPNLANNVQLERRPLDRYVLIDLGPDSLLEPITGDGNFRITMYNPDELAKTHCKGKHQYLLAKEAFEADVVINLPKLKTHRKSGITGALKNLVGINGNKDFLPHHRFGGSARGGDCYEGHEDWKLEVETYYDAANRNIGTPIYLTWIAKANQVFAKHGWVPLKGAWHGNDTCWRMNLDLNRCLLYGDASGNMHSTKQRTVISITDAIICGQGEGPLSVSPLKLSAITCSESSAAADLVHSALMLLDWRKINLLKGCLAPMKYPLLDTVPPVGIINQTALSLQQLSAQYGKRTIMPKYWQHHCELL